jgi:RND family efflux transporter MFP subunit
MRITKFITYLLITISFALSCDREQPKRENVVRVKTHEVQVNSYRFPIIITGTLSTSEEFMLSFKTGGIIKRIFVEEGQKTSKGTLLAMLELSEIEANVAQTEASVEKAKRDYQRTKNLFEDSVATKEQLQNSQTALDVAQSQLKIALFNLQHSKINAPENGKVLNILKEENELVSPGYPVIQYGSTTKNWIMQVNVTDKDLVNLNQGDSAKIVFDAYPTESFGGQITNIGSAADPFTNTYPIEISLNATNKVLATGFIGQVEIFPANAVTYPIIPYEGLLEGDELTGIVFVLKNDTSYEKRQVQIKRLLDEGIIIEEGLKKNERIIIDGLHYIDEDSKIKIVE